jgi:NAD(P)-dependent dehydrogenase (short-subunit alcohol dehydrogenase family)
VTFFADRAPTADAAPWPTLAGRTVVVTGASDGIGRAVCAAAAAAGATLAMLGRNEAKTAAAARAIMADVAHRNVRWFVGDLLRLDTVRDLAEQLRRTFGTIDVLVNNAGALFLDRTETADGLERTMALNHFAYVLLALELLPALAPSAARPARIVNVSSRAHRDAALDLEDLDHRRNYGAWRAYANSKLANVLFTRALATRLDPSRVVVHAVHPGVVSTRFGVNNGRRGRVLRRIMDVVSIPPERGADPLLWLMSSDDAASTSGDYWVKRRRVPPSAAALDPQLTDRLWARSMAVVSPSADATAALDELASRDV